MLHEFNSSQYITYVQKIREPKDDYAKRKQQKDKVKTKKLVDGLLADREVIIFFLENGIEKQVVGTTKRFYPNEPMPELPIPPVTIEVVNGEEVEYNHYCTFWEFPLRQPVMIHVDNITKFIVSNAGLDYDFFIRIKHDAT